MLRWVRVRGGGGAWGFSAAERGNESSKNKWNEFAITTTRKPTPSPFRDKGKKSLQKRRRRPELENEIKKNFLKRNASKKQKLPFHRDRRGMNFVNRFLLILISSSFVLRFFCWEFSFWTGPIFRPSPEPPAYLILHVLSGPPLIQSLACDCSHSPKRERRGIVRSHSVHVTNRTLLGPEFCELPDLDQELHYVVR